MTHDKYQILVETAKTLPPVTTAVAHPCDASSLSAAIDAAQLGLIVPILVGPQAKVAAAAEACKLDISGYERAIVITLDPSQRYDKVVITVDDPQQVAATINAVVGARRS